MKTRKSEISFFTVFDDETIQDLRKPKLSLRPKRSVGKQSHRVRRLLRCRS